MTLTPRQTRAVNERQATRVEVEAAVASYEAQAWRGGSEAMETARIRAHDALDRHLDAISKFAAMARA